LTKATYEQLVGQIQTVMDDYDYPDHKAFPFWFIENVFGKESSKIPDYLCDGTHDKGMDAILTDPIERNVIIIQSKFERQGNGTQLGEGPVKLLASVRDYFRNHASLNAALYKANQLTKKLANEAFEAIKKDGYALQLVLITTHKHAPQMDDLVRDTLHFRSGEFAVYDYSRIMALLADRERDYLPILEPYNLPYVDADKNMVRTTDHKSWVVTVSADEIRLFGNKYGKKLFKKNVRNSLGTKSKINRGIQQTLKDDAVNFWYYNNGITILSDEANLVPESKYVRIVNPQVINGCQTVWSITNCGGDLKSQVLVRVIEGTDHDFLARIARYQNTSNPVDKRDFKSSDPVQVRLKREFKRQGYYYEIKRGEEYAEMLKDYPSIRSEYKFDPLNNEDVAKVLAAVRISPDIATSKGPDYFFDDENYDDVFPETISTSDCLAPYHLYWNYVRQSYKGKKRFHSFDKAFIFKNPASYHVLSYITKALTSSMAKSWQNRFITFWNETEWDDPIHRKFVRRLSKVISAYFEVCHKSWEKRWNREGLDYNSFFQSSDSAQIKKEHSRELANLGKQTARIFEEFC
jgi:hypothetical protein